MTEMSPKIPPKIPPRFPLTATKKEASQFITYDKTKNFGGILGGIFGGLLNQDGKCTYQ